MIGNRKQSGQQLYNKNGERIMSISEYKAMVKRIQSMRGKNGTQVRVVQDKFGKNMPDGAAAAFDPDTGIIYVRNNPTYLELFHESAHAKQWLQQGGKVNYRGNYSSLAREEFVFREIMNNQHLFTPEEILRSQRVIFKYRNGAWPEDIIGPNWRPDPSDMSFWKGVDPESLPKPTGATKVDGMDAMPDPDKNDLLDDLGGSGKNNDGNSKLDSNESTNLAEPIVNQVGDEKSIFNHRPTSGANITADAEHGTFLIGSYPSDLEKILTELNYPKINDLNLAFPVPPGQKFNLLNITDELYDFYAKKGGGFFKEVNGPWIDAAVSQGKPIIVVSDLNTVYKKVIDANLNEVTQITGFGKEIHRLEWKHGYRFDPATKMMVPPSRAQGLPAITKVSDYK